MLGVRRVAIFVVILLGYAYYRAAGDAALASIGLLSFAAVAQIAPAFFGGLFWSRGTALGASAGLVIGFAIWGYTLLLPSLALEGAFWTGFVKQGPFGIALLKPTALFGARAAAADARRAVEPRAQPPRLCRLLAAAAGERRRAAAGDGLHRHRRRFDRAELPAFSGERHASTICARRSRAISARSAPTAPSRASRKSRGGALDGRAEADIHLLRYAEHLLASVIGAASSRLALSLLLRRRNVSIARRAAPPRRRLGGDPVQPRPPAARPRPCPPGHHRARPRPAPPRLEPRLHRPLRAAAGVRADRRRPRRDRPLQRRARLLRPGRRRGGRRRSASAASSTTPSRSASGCSRPAA